MTWIVDVTEKTPEGYLRLIDRMGFEDAKAAERREAMAKDENATSSPERFVYRYLDTLDVVEADMDVRPGRERLSRIMTHLAEEGNIALHRNLHKRDDWLNDTLLEIAKRLMGEILELIEAQTNERRREEAGDCEAYLAMVCDHMDIYEER